MVAALLFGNQYNQEYFAGAILVVAAFVCYALHRRLSRSVSQPARLIATIGIMLPIAYGALILSICFLGIGYAGGVH